MTDLQKLNREMVARNKADNGSHGLKILRELALKHFYVYKFRIEKYYVNELVKTKPISVFFKYITDNRLDAYVIYNDDLVRLCATEAGYKLYANMKDGYRGGYNQILNNLVYAMTDSLIKEIPERLKSNPVSQKYRQRYFQKMRNNFVARMI